MVLTMHQGTLRLVLNYRLRSSFKNLVQLVKSALPVNSFGSCVDTYADSAETGSAVAPTCVTDFRGAAFATISLSHHI